MSLFDETALQPDIGIPLFVAGVALSSLAVYLLNTSQPPSPEAVVTQPAADEPGAAPNGRSSDLYPYYNPSPFNLLSIHLTNPCG